jgi:hypothetical protein
MTSCPDFDLSGHCTGEVGRECRKMMKGGKAE